MGPSCRAVRARRGAVGWTVRPSGGAPRRGSHRRPRRGCRRGRSRCTSSCAARGSRASPAAGDAALALQPGECVSGSGSGHDRAVAGHDRSLDDRAQGRRRDVGGQAPRPPPHRRHPVGRQGCRDRRLPAARERRRPTSAASAARRRAARLPSIRASDETCGTVPHGSMDQGVRADRLIHRPRAGSAEPDGDPVEGLGDVGLELARATVLLVLDACAHGGDRHGDGEPGLERARRGRRRAAARGPRSGRSRCGCCCRRGPERARLAQQDAPRLARSPRSIEAGASMPASMRRRASIGDSPSRACSSVSGIRLELLGRRADDGGLLGREVVEERAGADSGPGRDLLRGDGGEALLLDEVEGGEVEARRVSRFLRSRRPQASSVSRSGSCPHGDTISASTAILQSLH